jgi:cobalt-zinc-cadmium resistance protein CzcA
MLERIIHFSIQQRYLVVLLTLLVAGIGVYSLQLLPIDAVPDITNNQVQINTLYPALSPVEVEKEITFVIENALAGIPGLDYTRSLSRNGFSQVTAVFEDSVDIYFARQQITERLSEAREDLPVGAEPSMGPIATGLGEVFMWTVDYEHPHGEGAEKQAGEPGWQPDGAYLTPRGQRLETPLAQAAYLRTVQDWIIRPQLKGVEDLAGVDAIGGFVKQYHVQPDPARLMSYGLSFHDVIMALEENNVSTGAGFIEHGGEAYLVRAAGRIESPEAIGNIVLGTRDGTPIYVKDVAEVDIGRELRSGSASANGEEVVVGTALMLIGGNSRTVAADVEAKLEEIARSLPPDIEVVPVINRTRLVDATIATVRTNLTEGAILVIVVLFVLLGNIRAALITALAIPLSMLMTATGMVQAGISGNLMSLGAIDFGLIVDGAVIIVENCLRVLGEKQHELGRPLTLNERLAQIRKAAHQMIRPSVFGQAIIITVYLPILALTGVEGKLFRPMALTVIFALVAAFVLSLTLIPALIAIVMRGKVAEKENFLIQAVLKAYCPTVRVAIRLRVLVVGAAVVAFVASLFLFQQLGQEFTPTLDEGDIAVQAARIPSTGIDQASAMQRETEEVIADFPEVEVVFSKNGTAEVASDPMPPNLSDCFIILKPKEEWPDRHKSKAELQEEIAAALAELPGSAYEFTQPIELRFNELIAGVRSDVAVKVFGDEFEEMLPVAESVASALQGVDGAADVKVEQVEGLPVMNIDIDRNSLARHGLNISEVQQVVAIAIGGRSAGQIFEGDRRFDIIVRLPENMRHDLEAVRNLPVPLPGHQGFLPLSALAEVSVSEGLNQISRENGKRLVIVQTNVRGRDIGSFVEAAQAQIASTVTIPPGMWLSWGGEFQNLASARQRLLIVVPLCFFMIFLLLFSSFNSVKYAAMVFTGVPLALSGGIVSLYLRDLPFSISAAVGFIALSGVATLNGLVMITRINELRAETKMPLDEAIFQGSVSRLRPVLMTALVASLGFVPMALAHGRGAEVQRPLATVVIGGLVTSTALTLIVIPALYRMMHRGDNGLPNGTEDKEVAEG